MTVVFPEVQFDDQPTPEELLLRGSSCPDASSEELLRVAEESAEVPAEELLRATSERLTGAIKHKATQSEVL